MSPLMTTPGLLSPRCRQMQCGSSAATFLRAAVEYYAGLGVRIRRVLTDNGGSYRSADFRHTCRRLGIRQKFTRPYTPRTNGKAERFIQTAIREWAYAYAYQSSNNASQSCLTGCTFTIGIGRTAVSVARHLSAGSVKAGTTS